METSRRHFLLSSGAAVGSIVATQTSFGASDTIQIGCIGTGGRCRRLMQSVNQVKGVQITALCDVWEVARNEAKKLAPNAVVYDDFNELLASKNVDAVVIGSPDHWHVPMTIAALKAGKDVYVEKPLTHSLAEGKAILDTLKAHPQIVQVGTQQRSMPHIQEAKQLVEAGKIGEVLKVTMSWNRNTDRIRRFKDLAKLEQVNWKAFLGNAPDQKFDDYRMRNWRWFWDFGGGIFTDLMVHWVDVAHWILNVESPVKAVSLGEHVASKGVWETPDTVQTILQYPNQLQMHFEGTFSNARHGARIEFMGRDATLYIDRGGYILTPERNRKIEPSEKIIGKGPRGADFYNEPDGELLHIQNWVDCIRSRKQPTAPISGGVHSANAAHLANEALRKGGVATWEPEMKPKSSE
ncbi:MAG: Gfo/Idh/MocA family oxidoreductase [Zavarzinella sp.]